MDLSPNSQPNPDKPKRAAKLESVVTGEVIKRKQSFGKRLKAVFFGGGIKDAARYITGDVVLPALRTMIVEASSRGVERVIYGETRPRYRSSSTSSYQPRVSYNQPIRRDPRERGYLPDQPPHVSRERYEENEIILQDKAEAELVIERLIDVISQYDVATRADLLELLGMPSSYVDDKWGWDRVAGFGVRQVREGYLLELPPAEPIKN